MQFAEAPDICMIAPHYRQEPITRGTGITYNATSGPTPDSGPSEGDGDEEPRLDRYATRVVRPACHIVVFHDVTFV